MPISSGSQLPGDGPEDAQRRDAGAAGLGRFHQHAGGRAVGQLRALHGHDRGDRNDLFLIAAGGLGRLGALLALRRVGQLRGIAGGDELAVPAPAGGQRLVGRGRLQVSRSTVTSRSLTAPVARSVTAMTVVTGMISSR